MAEEKRLIDANKLKEKAEPEEVTGEGIVYVQDIDDAPTVDAVEVVLCKDCKHFGKCSIYDIGNFNRYDFCSYGERRTDG